MQKQIRSHAFTAVLRPTVPSGSWVDRLQAVVDRRGRYGPLLYWVAAGGLTLLLHFVHWFSGALPPGRWSTQVIFAGSITALALAAIHHMEWVAVQSLARFRPLLSCSDDDYRMIAHRFITMSPLAILACHLAALIVFPLILWVDPTFFGLIKGYPLSDGLLYLVGWMNTGTIFVLTYYAFQQLSALSAVHDQAQALSLIDRGPTFAFSNLTYQGSVIGSLFIYSFFYLYPATRTNPVTIGIGLVGLTAVLAIFILPMAGMHQHLVDDKEQALREVRQAIETAFTQLHSSLDDREPAATETLAKRIDALLRHEQYLTTLPTWPWPPGTLARLLSVALLPLLLLVAQHVIDWFLTQRLLR